MLHSTEVPEGTFPDARDSGHHWVEVAKEVLDDEQQARLHRMYNNMPAKNTLVHGDMGEGNRITAKLRGWANYRRGDNVNVHFTKMHFFDRETENAIRKEAK